MSKIHQVIVGTISSAIIIAATVVIGSNIGPAFTGSNIPSISTSGAASLALVAPLSGTFDAGQTQNVVWTSENYGPSTVEVALIRKVSDNPARYELVRVIAPVKSNTGNATWVPAQTDVGNGLSIEIGCALSAQACTATSPSSELAVINDGRFANTASVFQAIEAAQNK